MTHTEGDYSYNVQDVGHVGSRNIIGGRGRRPFFI